MANVVEIMKANLRKSDENVLLDGEGAGVEVELEEIQVDFLGG